MNDHLKMTGLGRQKQLSEFNQLCLEFIKKAKGCSLSTLSIRLFITININSGSILKGNAAVEYIQSTPEPVGTDMPLAGGTKNAQGSEFSLESLPKPGTAKKRRTETQKENVPSNWKKEYFEHFKSTDQTRCEAKLQLISLKQYNFVLRNMELEKTLCLSQQQISTIRLSIDPDLNRYPTYSMEYVTEFEKSVDTVDSGDSS